MALQSNKSSTVYHPMDFCGRHDGNSGRFTVLQRIAVIFWGICVRPDHILYPMHHVADPKETKEI
jgi:hypothetical protein